jgi:hypothetical protein
MAPRSLNYCLRWRSACVVSKMQARFLIAMQCMSFLPGFAEEGTSRELDGRV